MTDTGYWLLKSEPETYSFDDLERDGKTNWNGVRNFQARNHLAGAKKGDLALIYHSGGDRCVVGVAEVTREAYPDPDPQRKGEWVQIDLKPLKRLARPVSLREIKEDPSLKDLLLVKQSRLSCMPVPTSHYRRILKMGETRI